MYGKRLGQGFECHGVGMEPGDRLWNIVKYLLIAVVVLFFLMIVGSLV